MAKLLNGLANFMIITCFFVLLFAADEIRMDHCDDGDESWVSSQDYTTPCDASDTEHLMACGQSCRGQDATVGTCENGACICCTVEDPYGVYKSRVYTKPCDNGDHALACDESCEEQGANLGYCSEGHCMCTQVAPKPPGTVTPPFSDDDSMSSSTSGDCGDNDDSWSENRLTFSPCDSSDLDHLYTCGKLCRRQELGIGACIDNSCMCCILNQGSWFKSRGYKEPCEEDNDEDETECHNSCMKQGADLGTCSEGVCSCSNDEAK